jgi:hypothetical protein
VIIRQFHVEHLKVMRLHESMQWCGPYLTDEVLATIAETRAYTGFIKDDPICIGGLLDMWPGRAMAFTFMSAEAGPYMRSITTAVREFLEQCDVRRVEAYVDEHFEAGHRWMGMLGFNSEGLLRAFLPNGKSQVIYSRINDG